MLKIFFSLLVLNTIIAIEPSNVSTKGIELGDTLLVHKTPTCGCCKKWVDHMKVEGFLLETKNHQSLIKIKDELKIDSKYRSCHTAVSSDGYFFEGHVPSKYVRKFLEENNKDARGLSVPGMPLGSPGMEVDGKFTPYDVLIHLRDGTTEVYAEIREL
tara:strand:- start:2865 stop:3338 length:474 start_codon:yes stop_codon:yes gene_type:complete